MTTTITRRALWLIPAAVMLHNLEEGLTFEAMWPTVQGRLADIGIALWWDRPQIIAPALAIMAAIVFALIAAAARTPTRMWLWTALLVQAVMLINAGWHVLIAVTVMHGYTPGLITAVALNVPLSWYVCAIARRERWISRTALLLLIPAALFLHVFGIVALMAATEVKQFRATL